MLHDSKYSTKGVSFSDFMCTFAMSVIDAELLDHQAFVTVGDHIQESLLQEDEVLLQYYDIASMRV